MNYYKTRKEIARQLTNWCQLGPETRKPWKHLVTDITVIHGLGERSIKNILRDISQDQLYIDKDNQLMRRETV